tara:strand:- start:19685 stop:20578 length:894 start_codon:yes stop_codon:yes gene_type:complete
VSIFGTDVALYKALEEFKMKALKRATLTSCLVFTFLVVAIGGYNTLQVESVQFNRNLFDIKLAKRLDEIKGEITIGRIAASVPKLKKTSTDLIKKQVQKIIPTKVDEPVESEVQEVVEMPEPVTTEDLELSLTGGLFNKKPLDKNSAFSGSAKIIDGIVEEVSVSLPDGEGFIINTNERMVGNVFQYEDTRTREMKSGLFYKVKPGVFMVTLTNDSQYPGLRLEFKTEQNVAMANESNVDSNWSLDDQNQGYPVDQQAEEQAFNEQDNGYDSYSEQNNEYDSEESSAPNTFGFNFQS